MTPLTGPDDLERAPQAARPGVLQEGHPEASAELPAHGRRVQLERLEIGVAPALVGLALDRVDEQAHQVRGLIGMRQRPTAQARTVGGEQRLLRVGEKLAVGAPGRACGTGRPAEHPGGAHPDIEHAVIFRIALAHRAVARVFVEDHGGRLPFATASLVR